MTILGKINVLLSEIKKSVKELFLLNLLFRMLFAETSKPQRLFSF